MRILFILILAFPVTLQAQQGFVQVTTNLDNFYLVANHNYEGVKLYQRGDKIPLEVGFNHVRLVWEGMNDFEQVILIQEDQVFELRPVIDFQKNPKKTSLEVITNYRNLTIYSDKESEIYINDTLLGTGFVQGMLNPGVYRLKMVHPNEGSLEKELIVRSVKHNEIFRFNKDPDQIPKVVKFVPGGGFYANGEPGKAALTLMGTSMLVFNVWVQNRSYERAYNRFDELVVKYRNERRQDRIPALRNEINAQLKTLDNRSLKLNISYLTAGLFYAYTTFRGFKKPKNGFGLLRESDKQNIRLTYQENFGVSIAAIKYTRNFR
ncbi:MAG: hypothetical protein NXI08_15335 [bacterium]|nr:hypothetical protein [bacterium]